jgi:hypothetical protein
MVSVLSWAEQTDNNIDSKEIGPDLHLGRGLFCSRDH